jgi:HEAT repeat protein
MTIAGGLCYRSKREGRATLTLIRLFDGITQASTPRAVRFAGSLLLDPHYPVRDFVAEALGELGSADAFLYLRAVLLDRQDDPQVQARAALSLGQIKAPPAEKLLVSLLDTIEETEGYDRQTIRFYALEGLGILNTNTAWRKIKEIVLGQESPDFRIRAIHLLVREPRENWGPILEQLVGDDVVEDVATVARYYLNREAP